MAALASRGLGVPLPHQRAAPKGQGRGECGTVPLGRIRWPKRALYAFSHVEWIRKRGGGTAGANASGSAQFRAQRAPSTRGSRGSGPVRSSGRPTGCSGHDCRARNRGRPLAPPDRPVIPPTARSRERKSPRQREGSTRRKLPACWRDVDRREHRHLYAVEWLVRNSVPASSRAGLSQSPRYPCRWSAGRSCFSPCRSSVALSSSCSGSTASASAAARGADHSVWLDDVSMLSRGRRNDDEGHQTQS